jgi:hypothetical protein
MGVARERAVCVLPPDEALDLWLNVRRWPTFVDGFAKVVEETGEWPSKGARVVWDSREGGRGRVTEKISAYDPARRVVVEVFDKQLVGTQTVMFTADEAGSAIDVALDYNLTDEAPWKRIADVIFIRRALRDSIARTLRRFTVEAAEEAENASAGS